MKAQATKNPQLAASFTEWRKRESGQTRACGDQGKGHGPIACCCPQAHMSVEVLCKCHHPSRVVHSLQRHWGVIISLQVCCLIAMLFSFPPRKWILFYSSFTSWTPNIQPGSPWVSSGWMKAMRRPGCLGECLSVPVKRIPLPSALQEELAVQSSSRLHSALPEAKSRKSLCSLGKCGGWGKGCFSRASGRKEGMSGWMLTLMRFLCNTRLLLPPGDHGEHTPRK